MRASVARAKLARAHRERLDVVSGLLLGSPTDRQRRRDRIAEHRPELAGHHHEVRRLVLVLPDDLEAGVRLPAEYSSRWAAELGVDQTYGGQRTAEGHRRWRHRARGAGHEDHDAPVLLWEHVGWRDELQVRHAVTLQPTDRTMVVPRDVRGSKRLDIDWTEPVRPVVVHVPDAGMDAELHLVGGDPTAVRVTLQLDGGGRGRVSWRADAVLEPEVPDPRDQELLPPTARDGRLVLTLSDLPPGTSTVRIAAAGAGVVEAATLLVGMYARVERHRRYHRVRLD